MPRNRTPEQLVAHREYMKKHREANKEKAHAREKERRANETPEQREKRLAYIRDWYARNRETQVAKRREEHHARKQADPEWVAQERIRQRDFQRQLADEVIAHYGGKCACCGETERLFLSIDHINNDGAEHRRSINPKAVSNGKGVGVYHWLRKNGYPEGFQVLCMNCNCGKARNGGVCPHQSR